MFVPKHLDHPTFEGGVVSRVELSTVMSFARLYPRKCDWAHLRFGSRTLLISCDQLQSASNGVRLTCKWLAMTCANKYIVFLWAILIIWDARKCEYTIQCRSSSDCKGSLTDANVHCWYLPSERVRIPGWHKVDARFQRILIFSISDSYAENSALIKGVYCDGNFLGSSWW